MASAHEESASPFLQGILVALEDRVPLWAIPTFVIAATLIWANATPRVLFSAGYIQIAAIPVMALIRSLEPKTRGAFVSPINFVEAFLLFLLGLVAVISFLINRHDPDSFDTCVFSYVVPAC